MKKQSKTQPKLEFETSKEFRSIFNEEFERWKKKNYGGLEELANRLGVSQQYLSQVARYGRIPGKPVIILIALNFDIDNPERLFRAAGIREPWAYDPEIRLGKISKHDSGFLSLKIDMDGFSTAIRDIIRSETKPRGTAEILGNRPLHIGLYIAYTWLYDERPSFDKPIPSGIMTDFCRMLGVSLQREVTVELLPFPRHISELRSGQFDMFGPMMQTPKIAEDILFTVPLQKVGISVLFKKDPSADLPKMPSPKSLNDLITKPYKIAVLRDSLPHLVANSKLQKSNNDLIICDSDDEAVDRLLVRGIKRPAHLYLANSLIAYDHALRHRRDLELLFDTKDTLIDLADISFAVRPDFKDILPMLNESINFLLDRGGFRERINAQLTGERAELAGLESVNVVKSLQR
jgi:transcriptional regulator with XRE-family HTH domain